MGGTLTGNRDAGANTVAVAREMERALETLRREVSAERLTVVTEEERASLLG